MKLWQKKGNNLNEKVESFTVGKDRIYDLHFAAYDCQASIAHAQMLGQIGVLTLEEADQLVAVLEVLKSDAEKGDFLKTLLASFTAIFGSTTFPVESLAYC